jgi:hypothetical protein
MASPSTARMFRNFTYRKPMADVREAMEGKIDQVKAKIAERKERIALIRKEFSISDQDLIELLTQSANQMVSNRLVNTASMSYSMSAPEGEQRLIGAGVVQNLLTEQALIDEEKAALKQLARIVRNLSPYTMVSETGIEYTVRTVELTPEELEYLGF